MFREDVLNLKVKIFVKKCSQSGFLPEIPRAFCNIAALNGDDDELGSGRQYAALHEERLRGRGVPQQVLPRMRQALQNVLTYKNNVKLSEAGNFKIGEVVRERGAVIDAATHAPGSPKRAHLQEQTKLFKG